MYPGGATVNGAVAIDFSSSSFELGQCISGIGPAEAKRWRAGSATRDGDPRRVAGPIQALVELRFFCRFAAEQFATRHKQNPAEIYDAHRCV
jgi:hypothetical protein